MEDNLLLLLLRLGAAGSLVSFLGMIVYFLWRDLRAAERREKEAYRVMGRLVVVGNEQSTPPLGARLPLRVATTLGRAPSNTIQLQDQYASNEHARVVQRQGQWWLEDQHSSNGTYLNGMPVAEPVVLSSGDTIAIGSVELRLELGEGEQ